MNTLQIKKSISTALKNFSSGAIKDKAIAFFNALGYDSQKRIDGDTPAEFLALVDENAEPKFNQIHALFNEWQAVSLLFQLTDEEMSANGDLFSKKIDNAIIESYLFFAITLQDKNYTRTALSKITREINKSFSIPILILFKHGETLTLALINRRLHKRDESKDVLEKVTLIKDINFNQPHRAHLEILHDFSLEELRARQKIDSFIALHQAWEKVLDTSELNKRFFKEIADWYFWAVQSVTFPQEAGDDATRNHISVIRLITRLIFVWFLKERELIPATLFDKSLLDKILYFKDTKGSTYYKAILQNLFFATLNQEMNTPNKPNNRKFRGKGKNGQRDQDYMVHNVYRYEGYFRNAKDTFDVFFANIPFLNGGLFECLDKKIRIDGFSEWTDNEICVPDILFFTETETPHSVDLNPAYGTKNKKYQVQGIINIFNRYKFTLTENTPIEEEIALDPELLGKVFENLLAAYNPETGTTARKQTGSFYTPREIVNYMVDESLITYLENQLGKDSEQNKLRTLISYNEENHSFNENEVQQLISAIDKIKILDPACGSGAFPMGGLHKLVYILSKLDPNNAAWKAQQIAKAREIPDSTFRDKAIEDIEQAFSRNELDYGRKLYLIQNCIFGIDIQPIAVQIAKLRFFISLLVDQKIDDSRENRGVRPLPNLETKFVAANTLIGLDKPAQATLRNPKIETKEKELAEVRASYFTARTPKTKNKYRERDEHIRAEIGELLSKDGFARDTTERLAKWNPYDQNASADFFDAEWMFGVKDGFDVVIGNPPYARVQTLQNTQAKNVEYYKKHYLSAKGSFDIYVIFIEKGFSLLNQKCIFSYIVPHKFFQSKFCDSIRHLLAQQKALLQIVRFGAEQVFKAATTYTCLLFLTKKPQEHFQLYEVNKLSNSSEILNFIQAREVHSNYVQAICENPKNADWNFLVGDKAVVLKRLREQSHTLGDIVRKIFQGIATSADKIYVLNVLEWKEKTVLCFSKSLNCEIEIEQGFVKPFLMGKDVHRYQSLVAKNVVIFPYIIHAGKASLMSQTYIKENFHLGWEYLIDNKSALSEREKGRMYGEKFYAYIYPKNLIEFETVKIMSPDICSIPQMTLDESKLLYHTTTLYSFVFKKNIIENPKYFLGVLNSQLLWFFLQTTGTVLRGGYLRFKTEYLKPFPIPCSLSKKPPTQLQHDEIVKLVDQILTTKSTNTTTDTSALETQIDQLVYQLYGLTDEEIKIVEEQ
ncbi:hypothetical protein PN36_13365 [Candidatus Thiomargarita nelsonii]|uniref:site-specific DNA-methyltransferase (adenine-specific) n=1 Tax=Candidatus Thiomargarita nelsonii TaxID=1003181 RepID=A0A4E0R409_9GAMM|nr:hypothetical protein PN36_13365 [Candidatus Thiomargarita nelsonii]